MFPLGKFIKVALHDADKPQLRSWLHNNERIEVPEISSSRLFKATQFQSQLTAFNTLHNWNLSSLHPCFVQMLGLEQQVLALSHADSPFSPFGMIQTENSISIMSPIHNGDLEVHCKLSAVRPSSRGLLVDVEISANQSGRCSLTAISTYLYKMSLENTPSDASVYSSTEKISSATDHQNEARLNFVKSAGRKYARISNDFNPIHLYAWSAKLFGYKRPIAHGMHTLAQVLSKLEQTVSLPALPAKITNRFVYPASLPCSTSLKFSEDLHVKRALSFKLVNPSASSRKQTVLTGRITSI